MICLFEKRGIYLAAYRAVHLGHKLVYQDINGERDICGDMMDVDLSTYDYIIATPPCNYYSRANWRRDQSEYSLKTKHLLPDIIDKLIKLGKPFIVENVRNAKLFRKLGLYNKACFIYHIGRHTYWTNVLMSTDYIQVRDNIHYIGSYLRQGGYNVHQVIENFIDIVESQ